ncbi:DegV family protein [Furfurilactobacillus curtus]|uniref:DegV family protein n=1 Tax=Furfurilactobacillus curtus TaxID=1746200 RepID=A0ABQ5JT24_9LACO
MTEKIALLVDSGSDVPPRLIAEKDNLRIVPLQITIDGQTYADGQKITPAEFYQRQAAAAELPKTASPTMGDIMTQIDDLKAGGYTHVIGITMSAALSVTNNAFQQAADSQTDVTMSVINTQSIGIGSGLFAVYAEDLIEAGDSFNSIVAKLDAAIPHSHVYFYIPTLTYLRAGGRIGRVAGLVGSALSIKPVITCDEEGVYTTIARARTEKKAIDKMIALAVDDIKSHNQVRVAVANGDNEPLMDTIIEQLHTQFPQLTIETGEISAALGAHTGPGLVGITVQAD